MEEEEEGQSTQGDESELSLSSLSPGRCVEGEGDESGESPNRSHSSSPPVLSSSPPLFSKPQGRQRSRSVTFQEDGELVAERQRSGSVSSSEGTDVGEDVCGGGGEGPSSPERVRDPYECYPSALQLPEGSALLHDTHAHKGGTVVAEEGFGRFRESAILDDWSSTVDEDEEEEDEEEEDEDEDVEEEEEELLSVGEVVARSSKACSASGPTLEGATPASPPKLGKSGSYADIVKFGGSSRSSSSTSISSLSLSSLEAGSASTCTLLPPPKARWRCLDGVMDSLPPQRHQHSCVPTIDSRVVLLFGGDHLETPLCDMYQFTLLPGEGGVWRRISPGNAAPRERRDHACVVVEDTMFLFGGVVTTNEGRIVMLNDLHAFDTKQHVWRRVNAPGADEVPCPRMGHSLFVSPLTGRLMLFGGCGSRGRFLNDVLEFDSAAEEWYILNTSGESPDPRRGHSMCIRGKYMFVFGGNNTKHLNNVYRLNLEKRRWRRVETFGEGPSVRSGHGSFVLGDYWYIFGGSGGFDRASLKIAYYNDLYRLHLDSFWWQKLPLEGQQLPPPRFGCGMVGFPEDGQAMLFGGGGDGHSSYGDTWVLDLDDELPSS